MSDNAYMAFGRQWENWIVNALPESYGLKPNDWLIRSEHEKWHLATPDALNDDWTLIGEVKTTGKDWANPPIQYVRQVQWQMYVTGEQARACVFAWLLRSQDHQGDFVPGWYEPKHIIIDRDDTMIEELKKVATRLQNVIAQEIERKEQWNG